MTQGAAHVSQLPHSMFTADVNPPAHLTDEEAEGRTGSGHVLARGGAKAPTRDDRAHSPDPVDRGPRAKPRVAAQGSPACHSGGQFGSSFVRPPTFTGSR